MQHLYSYTISVLALAVLTNVAFAQSPKNYLHLVVDSTKDEYAYLNVSGDTVIPFGKYRTCYTRRFDKLAIVSLKDKGLVGIDRSENILFNVFVFDNGPDYPSDGLFRIIKDGKIGYADLNGNIVIEPKFDCAYPFKHGKAKVSTNCKTKTIGEHHYWTSKSWYIINKKGVATTKYYTRK